MPKRNRGTFFAIGLVAGVALAFLFLVWSFPGFRNPAYQQERYSYSQNPETGDNNPVVRPSLWETYTLPTDTYAQWLMAVFSVFATGVSIWAVRLLRDTLEATREAVRSADDAVTVTRDIGKAQVRAYVLPAHARIEFPEDNDPIVHLAIRNFGQTPANDLRSWIHIWVEDFPLRVGLPEAPEDLRMAQSVLGPGFHHDFEHKRGRALNDVSLKMLADETAAIYVYGTIRYVDCFGEPHVTHYRLIFRGKIPDKRKSRLMHDTSGNEAD